MTISVGILERESIDFQLNNAFFFEQEKKEISGKFSVNIFEKKIIFNGKIYDELIFCNKNSSVFTLFDVKIGINFHWEQFENQHFEGDLKIVSDGEKLVAINIIDIEKYLCSVISSEMSAMSFPELLKAHAVISRSWLLASLEPRTKNKAQRDNSQFSILNSQFIKWYERDAHTLFDVCADDHCQRYQGVSDRGNRNRRNTFLKRVTSAVEATKGEVLVYKNEICDTRFSKCCGGKTELFSSCWADNDFDYLTAKIDWLSPSPNPSPKGKGVFSPFGGVRGGDFGGVRGGDFGEIKGDDFCDLTQEKKSEKFILSSPKCFCNTNDKAIINQIFKDFDKKTNDFFRWKVEYSNAELSDILKEKSGIDFGKIIDLIPLKRGQSGRITLLKIVGTKQTLSVGKELEIRRWLSKSHLYSSAFMVKKDEKDNFVLHGAGWGHGVGLCQIGAAVMSAQGYNYKEILAHYFDGTEIVNI